MFYRSYNILSYIVAYLVTNLADVKKTLLADGLPYTDPYLPCLSFALAGSSFGECHNVAGGSNVCYVYYAHIRWKGGYVFIPVYILPVTHRFLYTKNATPVDNIKVTRLRMAVRVFFENLFSDEKNTIKNKTNKNETNKNKTENKTESENETE